MAGSGKWARTLVVSGPPEGLTDEQIAAVATLRQHFYRRDGYLGSHLLVDKENGVIRSTGFWATREDLERSRASAEQLGERLRKTLWDDAGTSTTEVSEIYVMDPCDSITFEGDYIR